MDKRLQKLPIEALELIAARFRALGEPARLQLLQCLMSGEKSVQELCEETSLSQANTSKHLGVLADHGIVARRKDGLYSIYFIADDTVYQMCSLVCGSLTRRMDEMRSKLRR